MRYPPPGETTRSLREKFRLKAYNEILESAKWGGPKRFIHRICKTQLVLEEEFYPELRKLKQEGIIKDFYVSTPEKERRGSDPWLTVHVETTPKFYELRDAVRGWDKL